jgi:aminoglycoside phosphotransferase (APT) family kinase protein
MPAAEMPAAEVDIDVALVGRLLEEQFPDLASLPLSPLGSGWDNAVFRLGPSFVVRLPRRAMSAPLVEHEQRWLPELASRLPLPIPAPVRAGRPSLACAYPWSWSVCPWFEGEPAAVSVLDDARGAASSLGAFVRALHRPAPADAPVNPYRGGPLSGRDAVTRDRVAQLGSSILDTDEVSRRWEAALAEPPWEGEPVWLHGDLHPANVLVAEGRVSAVIDFGDLTSGDPATDLSVAWMILPEPEHRDVFRAAAGDVADATWARARGWALCMAVAYLANSADHPVIATVGRRTLATVLEGAP